jgi:hypothetical protein
VCIQLARRYGFDGCWVCDGLSPDDRFRMVEDKWSYLLGWVVLISLSIPSISLSLSLCYLLFTNHPRFTFSSPSLHPLCSTPWRYGLPYGILIRSTGFFVGYGIYLVLFPFCIIIACNTDLPSRTLLDGSDSEKKRPVIPSLPLFELPQYITSFVLGIFDKRFSVSSGSKSKNVRKKTHFKLTKFK